MTEAQPAIATDDTAALLSSINTHVDLRRRQQEDRIVALYREGVSIAEIASQTLVSRKRVRAILVSHGIAIRKGGAVGISDDQRALIVQLSAQGVSVHEIAERVGLGRRRVYELLRVAGRPGLRPYGKCGIALSPHGSTDVIAHANDDRPVPVVA